MNLFLFYAPSLLSLPISSNGPLCPFVFAITASLSSVDILSISYSEVLVYYTFFFSLIEKSQEMEIFNLPPVTRVMIAGFAVTALLATFDFIHPLQMLYSPSLVFEQKQYWRLVTNYLFFGKLSIHFLLELRWMCTVSSTIEHQFFFRQPINYCATLVFGCVLLLLARTIGIVDAPFLSFMFGNMLVYLFSRLLPDQNIAIMGVVTVPMRMFPIAFTVLSVAYQGLGSIKNEIVGNMVGHIVWYFLEVFPRVTDVDFLHFWTY